MLKQISWAQFGFFLFAAIVVYYLYVLVRFYHKEIGDLLAGKKRRPAPARKEASASPTSVDGGQASLFGTDRPDETPELFKVMEKVISDLKTLVGVAVADRWGAEELKDRIQEVLGKFGQLKKTPYQIAINNYIVRVCSSNFSLVLDEDELEGLWG